MYGLAQSWRTVEAEVRNGNMVVKDVKDGKVGRTRSCGMEEVEC